MKKKITSGVYLGLLFIATLILVFEKSEDIYPALIAVGVFGVIFGLMFFISARLLFSAAFTGTLFIIFKFLNQIKVHYYKEQLMFSDLNLMFDPANQETLHHYWLAGLGVVAMFIWLIFNMTLSWKKSSPLRGFKWRTVGLVLAAFCTWEVSATANAFREQWESSLPKGRGTVTNMVMSAKDAKYHAPQFGQSSDYFLQQAKNVVLPVSQSVIKPDVVMLLQESTVTPHIYQLPDDARLPNLYMFQRDSGVSAQSPMRVQTFGGGTWLSEFSALTGLNTDDFGSRKNAVFYFIVDHLKYSLFREMKQNGYYTVVLTPFNKSSYHSGHAYQTLGVDRIIQPQELGYPASPDKNLWTISTQEMLGYVKDILAQETDKPLFIFSLTMYEHGPYDEDHTDDYGLTGHVKNSQAVGKFSHYMEKIKASDPAIKDFSEFVAKREKPTIFLYFGDHQPNISLNQYNGVFSNPGHITQFTMRDNLQQGESIQTDELTDISFLGSMIMERAKLDASPFYRANMTMRHLCRGALDDCQDKALVESYKHYIYQQLDVAGKK
ncbi:MULTISPECIES: LTA synthase family protein [unclassified Photorhabdus]|uniref:LTA synthase family protein n=1 Tax=unclassified Photorhabdus TaxID=2620880 RepID=UPI000DCEF170|nr:MULTISPECIES: LTA synthase family protein [unclassified Photorhabdus]RAW94448.1 phosphoethanolamine transferase [Photorhabdus sp. S9-53]RAW94627.1 phosphoethanolamine transferase [Photorhabdus sp. S10-54]RAW98507.1 phosphoethanolamine transferase [Photorhabdus sp. S8-52]